MKEEAERAKEEKCLESEVNMEKKISVFSPSIT